MDNVVISDPAPEKTCWLLRFVEKMKPADLAYDSWRTKTPQFLSDVLTQKNGFCWAIARTRQLEFLLRSTGRLSVGESLSIQELVNLVPQESRAESGGLINPEAVRYILLNIGTVLESERQLSYDTKTESTAADLPNAKRFRCESIDTITVRDYRNVDVKLGLAKFENVLEEELRRGPVTVHIPVTRPYVTLQRKQLYNPSIEELRGYERIYGGHELLCVGVGVDADGNGFYECQDSDGKEKGDGGYVRVAKGFGLIKYFVAMRV